MMRPIPFAKYVVAPFILVTAAALLAAVGDITTFAGTGAPGSGGDGGPATAAQFGSPAGIAVDAAGNWYIADFSENRVRKIDAAGIITTFAGTGAQGFGGDGGAATAAQLNGPFDVAVDGNDNVYIADVRNYRVRRVDAAGIITTFAGSGAQTFAGDGGPATAAGMSATGVAADPAGIIYVADQTNNRIRRVDLTGQITTFAGNGTLGSSGDGGLAIAAAIRIPPSVDVDGAGNVYISEQGSNRVRKVDASGFISTFAGNGIAGFSGDGGPATAARISGFPFGIVADAAGNVYFADRDNHRVRMVDPAGTIVTVAGTGVSGSAGDGGPATSAQLAAPTGLALDAAGHLYIVENSGNRIRRVTVNPAPVAAPGTLSVAEDASGSGTLVANDPGGLPLTFSIVSNGLLGSVSITDAATGAYTYVPDPDVAGVDAFTFKASNGTLDSNVAGVTVTIDPVNDAPVAVAGALTAVTDTPASGTLAASDVDTAALSYSVVTGGTRGTALVTDASTGAYTYTPNAGTSGIDTFTFRANDGVLDSNVETVTVTIFDTGHSGVKFQVLHSFTGCAPTGCQDGNDGSRPVGALMRASNGVVYGTTGATGSAGQGAGTIFAVSPGTGYANAYTFDLSSAWSAGCFPLERLVESGGVLHGIAQGCGVYGDGTIFGFALSGAFSKLHDLTEGIPQNNGVDAGGVAFGLDGRLYGITRYWGANNLGSVYRLETDGSVTTVHSFAGTDGQWPAGELMRASDGSIYGITTDGGSSLTCAQVGGSCGTVYRIRPSGLFEVVHTFLNTATPFAAGPQTGLVEATDGHLYGLAGQLAYRLDRGSAYTPLHVFDPVLEGYGLEGVLAQGADGYFYGVLSDGGPTGKGALFRMAANGDVTILHRFTGPDGARPFGGLTGGADGHLYGTTYDGGANNLGIVFRLELLSATLGSLTVVQDTPTTGTLVATDPNNAPLTFSIVANGSRGTATVTDAATGAFLYTPNPQASGYDSFTFKASSGGLDSTVATVAVHITPLNNPPIAVGGSAVPPSGSPLHATNPRRGRPLPVRPAAPRPGPP